MPGLNAAAALTAALLELPVEQPSPDIPIALPPSEPTQPVGDPPHGAAPLGV